MIKSCPVFLIVAVLLTVSSLHASSLVVDMQSAEEFVRLLLEDRSVSDYVAPQALHNSERLGIQYTDVEQKYLVSYDIDREIKDAILNAGESFKINLVPLDNEYTRLNFSGNNGEYKRSFYFKAGKLVPPVVYFSRSWQILESRYFRFHISDSSQFNPYCMQNLDSFFVDIAKQFKYNDEQINQIQSEKIDYYLCRDSDEIHIITGFQIRGTYDLAYDFIITTFNAHYHELIHLLVNYKLQKLPLYTHPFFQEGIAVACGGRGGKEPAVILQLGLFLYQSEMLRYQDLFSHSGFNQLDASLSYPASGLYHLFLLQQLGVERYFELYLKYSGTAECVWDMIIKEDDLPVSAVWQQFLDEFSPSPLVTIKGPGDNVEPVYNDQVNSIQQGNDYYYFQVRDTLLIPSENDYGNYKSDQFAEVFDNRPYHGEKYLVLANANEISVYNLYTNTLVANYVSSFKLPPKPVPQQNGMHRFSIARHVFDKKLGVVVPVTSNHKEEGDL